MDRAPDYRLVACGIEVVRDMCERYHGYGGAGNNATYAFCVMEQGLPVAAFSWQPPPPGAASSVCPEAPQGVLSLSRMVAVPKEMRSLNHISKPLRRQMRQMIDRTRWPVLVTFSDESLGHTGHVYRCSGWQKTSSTRRPFYLDGSGRRTSTYSDGRHNHTGLVKAGMTTMQRWEHWACPKGEASLWMESHGWERRQIAGVWRSGNPRFTYVKRGDDQLVLL